MFLNSVFNQYKAKKRAQKPAEQEDRKAGLDELASNEALDDFDPGVLSETEIWWRDHFNWLKDCGYQLRPRYAPDWVPSWQKTKALWYKCEDSQIPMISYILDATRISDESFVTLKLLNESKHPYEVRIAQYLSSDALASDPSNHCVPIYEVLQIPEDDNQCILVMPLLRNFMDPRFDTVGEVIECFRQLFEGLFFMHKLHVAHRDCMDLNIMMDARALFLDAYHPCRPWTRRDLQGIAQHLTRTQCPVKYYFIDFGISTRLRPDDDNPLVYPIRGGDKSAPEFRRPMEPCNPYFTDVYNLGNMIRENFIRAKCGFEFMAPLVHDMVQDEPSKRPKMAEVVAGFDEICRGLSKWKLRSRVVDKDDSNFLGLLRAILHWKRRMSYIIRRVPPIPKLPGA